MITIRTLRDVLTQHDDQAYVLVAVFRGEEGRVYQVIDWEANGEHLQLNIIPDQERRYKRLPPMGSD